MNLAWRWGKNGNSKKSPAPAAWSRGGSGSSTPEGFLFVLLVSTERYHLGSTALSSVRAQGEICSSLRLVKRLHKKQQERGLGNGQTEQLGGCDRDFRGSRELCCAEQCLWKANPEIISQPWEILSCQVRMAQ